MNWENVDLNSSYEREQNILDPYDFDTLLLEVSYNIKEINEDTVMEQALLSLKLKQESALEIIRNNIANITKQALKERKLNNFQVK